MIAGPSEIMIIADEFANENFIAADLMSQAEHDVLASAMLITTSKELAKNVVNQLQMQIKDMSRADIIKQSLEKYGVILIVDNVTEAIQLANRIAPEHLEVMLKDPFDFLGDIKNAGSIFLGQYAPEPLGDYIAGPNHVLPTSGTAKFFSPLSVDDFIKKSSYIYYTKEALSEVKDKVIKLSEVEGLSAHGNSIKVRFKK
jgi:histidinol dehydrogenase